MRPEDDWLEMLVEFVHDMRTPISAARGYMELMQTVGPLNEKQSKYAERAGVAIQQLERLVLNMLDVAWLDADKPLQLGVCDLAALIDDAMPFLRGIADRRGITIDIQISPTLGLNIGDSRRLSAVVYNLSENAVKYNNDRGSVTISAYGTHDTVTLSVADTGVGITPEDQPKVFDRFFRAEATSSSRAGSGLGLAIVREVVEMHQGHIALDSRVGRGTTFTLTLPRIPPGADTLVPPEDVASVLARLDRPLDDGIASSEVSDSVDDDTQESIDMRIDRDDQQPV